MKPRFRLSLTDSDRDAIISSFDAGGHGPEGDPQNNPKCHVCKLATRIEKLRPSGPRPRRRK